MNTHHIKPLIASLALLSVVYCKKTEATPATTAESATTVEEDLVQPEIILTNAEGTPLKVVYFAEGNAVAVKLTKAEEPQKTLHAKGTSEKGNPLFTDGEWTWEMSEDGTGGTLTDAQGKTSVFKK